MRCCHDGRLRRTAGCFAVCLLLGMVCPLATPVDRVEASILNVNLCPFPDINPGPVTVNYQNQQYTVSANGVFQFFPQGYNSEQDFLGLFSLSAKIDNSGELQPSPNNLLSVIDKTDPHNQKTLLTGQITAFGYTSGASQNQQVFLFTATGGDLESLYGSAGAIRMTVPGFPGFAGNWARPRNGTADIDPVVPEPSALIVWCLLGAFGALVALWQRRRGARVDR